MGSYASNIIGIRTGGLLSGETDMDDLVPRILAVANRCHAPVFENAISRELEASKGCFVVIGGVFNYWSLEDVFDFAKSLSEEFATFVTAMSWHEETDQVEHRVFVDGKLLEDHDGNPFERVL